MITDWSYANSVRDKIVAIGDGELKAAGFSPQQFLAGLLLGVVSFQRSAAGEKPAQEFIDLHDAACRYINFVDSDHHR